MNPEILRKNAESRDRLLALVEHLDEQTLNRQVEAEWSLAALLAHVAFWDQICAVRWDAYDRGGSLVDVPDTLIDLINAANVPTWRALSGRAAVDVLRRAMEETDARIARLPDTAVQVATSGGFTYMLDRTGHRDEHATQIAAFLNG
ncbi:MAG: DinB family protein [Thermomicrobiales bacterium]